MFNVGDTAILRPVCIYTPGVLIFSKSDIEILIRARTGGVTPVAWFAQNYIDWGTGCFIPKAIKIAEEPGTGYHVDWRAILPIDSLPGQRMWWIPVRTLLPPPPVTRTRRLTVKQFN